jgi:chromosome segregation ATPase
VTRSTYEEVLAELQATKTEIGNVKEQSAALSQEAAELEQLKADLERQFETAAIALQRGKDNAEAIEAAAHRQLSQLGQKLNQLSAQQNHLRLALQRARDEEPSLQDSVESFKAKLQETEGPRGSALSAIATADHLIATPASNTATGSSVAQPTPVAVSTVAPQAAQPPSKPAVPAAPAPEQADEGLLAAIRNWFLSLWRSIFS